MRNSQLQVLLVEDDLAWATLVGKALDRTGGKHRVTHVARISNALCELAVGSYDVVLTDLTLPDASGLRSVEELRSFNPHLPVIVMTGLESDELADEALQLGAQDYISKDSINSQVLDLSIRYAIERQKGASENLRLLAERQTQQECLKQKNERLQRLVETAHRFVDNVSHEFRTPLTVLREYAALLRDGVLGEINEEQAEFLDVMSYRVDDLNTMVDDMLDSSKLEAGLMGVHRDSVDLVSVVERSLLGLQLKAQVRSVELTFDPASDLPDVYCDAEKVGRVVTNLVSNAIKFSDELHGEVHVEISHSFEEPDVRVSVADNGHGIDEVGLSKMFDRFKQLGTSTQSSTKGFGLGLNIARELVDLNYGEIRVDSVVGEGSTFSFTVPVDDWSEIIRRFADRLSRRITEATVVVVHVVAVNDQSEACIREISAFWRFTERQPDLIRLTGEAQWTLLIATELSDIDQIIDRFKTTHAQVSRNRPAPLPTLEYEVRGCFAVQTECDSLIEVASRAVCPVC